MALVRKRLLPGLVAALALAVAALSAQGPAPAAAASASGSGLAVQLHASTTSVLQFHGVLFEALPSGGDVTGYVFTFGDGTNQYSYQPYVMHGYQQPGTYTVRVGVLDSTGQVAASPPVTIHVIDGVPPVVRIDHPTPNQRVHLGRGGLTLSGTATDAGGVSKVQLAIQLVSSSQHFNAGSNCIWYDGRTWLVLASCASPHYFTVRHGGGRWSFHISGKARIPAGGYVIQVRAIDRAGNISHYYAVSLRTILPFTLTR